MATGANGAAGAFGTGPSAGYISIVFLYLIASILELFTGNLEQHIFIITYMLLYFWIKINKNLPNFLTKFSELDLNTPSRAFLA